MKLKDRISSLTDEALARAHRNWHDTVPEDDPTSAEVQAHNLITVEMSRRGISHGHERGGSEPFEKVVEYHRSTVHPSEALTRDGLPANVVDALRAAVTDGWKRADIVAVLTVDGYEMIVRETPSADGVDKRVSFAEENRVIARNRKRKAAQEPHSFAEARWTTRDGRVRCLTCGGNSPEDGVCKSGQVGKAAIEVPDYIRANAKRGLAYYEDGRGGDGLMPKTVREARSMSEGTVTLDKAKRMAAWFARHKTDLQSPANSDPSDPDYPAAGLVAWLLWGGDSNGSDRAQTWAEKQVVAAEQVGKGDPSGSAVHVDTIMPSRRRRKDSMDGEDPQEEQDEIYNLSPRQVLLSSAFLDAAEIFGMFTPDSGPDGAHYMEAAGNPFAQDGIACANCVFYNGDGQCEIVAAVVEDAGVCKLWVIPEEDIGEGPDQEAQGGTESAAPVAMAYGPHRFKSPVSGVNCAVCGQSADSWRHEIAKQTVVKSADMRFTLGPMYVPDSLDAHGEWTDGETLQQAVWKYVRDGDRRIRLQHNRDVVAGEWVEIMTFPYALTVPMLTPEGDQSVTYPPNTVFLGVVWEPWAWDLVINGKLRGYSIGGKAQRVLADLPEQEAQA